MWVLWLLQAQVAVDVEGAAESPPEPSEILSELTEAFPYGLLGEFLHLESLI